MRATDLTMINMSDLDNYLLELQQQMGDGRIYKSYGDRLFHLMACISRAHVGDIHNPMTEEKRRENAGMKAVRVTIENNFAGKHVSNGYSCI